ncbi:MAG: radical SAM protein [Chloroflexota bacterium]|nr:MAG: radical SAM protein [Chloroflexota bacterium]
MQDDLVSTMDRWDQRLKGTIRIGANAAIAVGRAIPGRRLVGRLLPPGWTSALKVFERRISSVQIEITTYCNLKCSGCIRTIKDAEGNWQNRHLSVEDFSRLVTSLPRTDRLHLYGIGEPTMHPKLIELVSFAVASKKFKKISLTSNGLARSVDFYRSMFSAGVSMLSLSVDSLDAQIASQVRAGTDVIRLVDRLKELCSEFPGKIEITTVLGRHNIRTASELFAELDRLGPLRINIQPYDDLGNPGGCLSVEERAWFIHEIPTLARRFRNLVLSGDHLLPSLERCTAPWFAPYISVDGYVTPCGRLTDPKVINFGNVLSSDFHHTWFGSDAEKWREQFVRESPNECAGCPMHISRICPRA